MVMLENSWKSPGEKKNGFRLSLFSNSFLSAEEMVSKPGAERSNKNVVGVKCDQKNGKKPEWDRFLTKSISSCSEGGLEVRISEMAELLCKRPATSSIVI